MIKPASSPGGVYHIVVSCLIAACVADPAWAGGSTFQDNIAAYRADSRPVESAPFNSGFTTNLAISQAKTLSGKGMNNVGMMSNGNFTTALTSGAIDSNGAAVTGGGLSIASPIITGTVRGNVTVVVQKGAIKGNITAVAPG